MINLFVARTVAALAIISVPISAHASGMAFDGTGNLFVGTGNGSIFKLTPDGKKSTFASGLQPEHLAFDRSGNLFVSDRNNVLALLRKEKGAWRVVVYDIGSTDYPSPSWQQKYKAPPQIFH